MTVVVAEGGVAGQVDGLRAVPVHEPDVDAAIALRLINNALRRTRRGAQLMLFGLFGLVGSRTAASHGGGDDKGNPHSMSCREH